MEHEGVARQVGDSAPLSQGAVIGDRFRIEGWLGRGGLGELYSATDQKTQDSVGIRVLAAELVRSEPVLERLRAHVKQASTTKHKNLVRLLGIGKHHGQRYLAMELVEGQSLRDLMERKKQAGQAFSLKGAYNLLAHVCSALAHCHPHLVHGLVGPGEILINRAGRVKLSEVGVFSAIPAHANAMTRSRDAYALPPELRQGRGGYSPATDLYSLGVTLYEMLAGAPPDAAALQPLSQRRAGMPEALDRVIAKCLAQDPTQRYGDAEQLKRDFYAAVNAVQQSVAFAPQSIAPSGVSTAPAAMVPQQAAAAAHPASKQVKIEDLLAQADSDADERWLIQKERLDFGPFSLGGIKRALYEGEFAGDDVLVDQETGDRTRIRQHPALEQFIRHLERHQAQQQAQQIDDKRNQQQRRRRNLLLATLSLGVLVLVTGGVIVAFLLTREPEVRERIVYRESTKAVPGLQGIQVKWNAEPAEQAKQRKRMRRTPRRKRTAKGDGQHVTRLGDATQSGGDALLSQKVVQQVMRSNFSKLTRCVQREWQRNRRLRTVKIDFGVRGSGEVAAVKVNGQDAGPFQTCVSTRMRKIRFPKFDGSLTRASFSMKLQI